MNLEFVEDVLEPASIRLCQTMGHRLNNVINGYAGPFRHYVPCYKIIFVFSFHDVHCLRGACSLRAQKENFLSHAIGPVLHKRM